jgi:hypothetical protein
MLEDECGGDKAANFCRSRKLIHAFGSWVRFVEHSPQDPLDKASWALHHFRKQLRKIHMAMSDQKRLLLYSENVFGYSLLYLYLVRLRRFTARNKLKSSRQSPPTVDRERVILQRAMARIIHRTRRHRPQYSLNVREAAFSDFRLRLEAARTQRNRYVHAQYLCRSLRLHFSFGMQVIRSIFLFMKTLITVHLI